MDRTASERPPDCCWANGRDHRSAYRVRLAITRAGPVNNLSRTSCYHGPCAWVCVCIINCTIPCRKNWTIFIQLKIVNDQERSTSSKLKICRHIRTQAHNRPHSFAIACVCSYTVSYRSARRAAGRELSAAPRTSGSSIAHRWFSSGVHTSWGDHFCTSQTPGFDCGGSG